MTLAVKVALNPNTTNQMVQIQGFPTNKIRHDRKTNLYTYSVKYGFKYGDDEISKKTIQREKSLASFYVFGFRLKKQCH